MAPFAAAQCRGWTTAAGFGRYAWSPRWRVSTKRAPVTLCPESKKRRASKVSRLRELREGAVLTVRELSQMSGVSEDAITKIENDHRRARPSTIIRRLAKALDVEPRELMASSREAPHPTRKRPPPRCRVICTGMF